jgi:hypothetical protein
MSKLNAGSPRGFSTERGFDYDYFISALGRDRTPQSSVLFTVIAHPSLYSLRQ